MTGERVILLEFNEICPQLLDKFMSEGSLPNFRRFYDNSDIYVTQADITDTSELEPWIQWYSIHTGLDHKEHGVFSLTDGPRASHEDIWRVLLRHGKKVGNCGSMNSKGFNAPGSFFLPDPWCTSEPASPSELGIFHKSIARQVQEYTNKGANVLSTGELIRFLTFLLLHGLRSKTVSRILHQLIYEKLIDGNIAWKRAVLLDKLQFDVFRFYTNKLRPDFATFFINSTAHYQHTYWRHMFPESFATKPSASEIAQYKNAILFGYQEMDKLLFDVFRLARDGTKLILASALSQKAFLKRDESGGQHFYRLRNVDSLLQTLGISHESVLPVMTHQYVVTFKDQSNADEAMKTLKKLTYEGSELFGFGRAEPKTIYFGSQVFSVVSKEAAIQVEGSDGRAIPFYDVFYRIEGTKSGCHHPDGVLWIYTGKHKVHAEKVSVLDIFPTVLNLCGVHPGAELQRLYQGRRLLDIAAAA